MYQKAHLSKENEVLYRSISLSTGRAGSRRGRGTAPARTLAATATAGSCRMFVSNRVEWENGLLDSLCRWLSSAVTAFRRVARGGQVWHLEHSGAHWRDRDTRSRVLRSQYTSVVKCLLIAIYVNSTKKWGL